MGTTWSSSDGPLRVLLVEDCESNVVVTRAYLRRMGHSLDVMYDGKAFRDGYRAGAFDLILMDIQLPHYNGYQLTEFVRSELQDQSVPIIGVSAGKAAVCAEQAIQSGMDAFLEKPIDWATLADEMDRLTAKRDVA